MDIKPSNEGTGKKSCRVIHIYRLRIKTIGKQVHTVLYAILSSVKTTNYGKYVIILKRYIKK